MSQIQNNLLKFSKKLSSSVGQTFHQYKQNFPSFSTFESKPKSKIATLRNTQCSIRKHSTASSEENSVCEGPYSGSLIVNDEAKTNEKDKYKTLIWMHGLGDTPHGFADIFQQLAPSTIRVVLLQAPTRPITINGGWEMPGWYDIISFSRDTEDKNGIEESGDIVNKCIQLEIDAIPDKDSNRVYVGGFSQGAAMALHCGYQYPKSLGGIISLSGYALSTSNYPKAINEKNKDTKLFACHGKSDPTVPFEYGKATIEEAFKKDISMRYIAIPNMGHQIVPQEIVNACRFIDDTDQLFARL